MTAAAAAEPACVPASTGVDDPRVATVEWERGLDCPDETRAAERAYEAQLWGAS